MKHSEAIKEEAIRLRVEERKSLKAISDTLKIAKSTASLWLQNYPLTDSEKQNRYKENAERLHATRKPADVEAKKRPDLSKADLGEAARQMICARLMLNGLDVFRPMTEDNVIDLLVLKKDGSVLKCQCKYIYPTKQGFHNMSLYTIRKNSVRVKRHRYQKTEIDFFLGYCLDDDSVYIIPNEDVAERDRLNLWILRKPVSNSGKTHFDHLKYKNKYKYLE